MMLTWEKSGSGGRVWRTMYGGSCHLLSSFACCAFTPVIRRLRLLRAALFARGPDAIQTDICMKRRIIVGHRRRGAVRSTVAGSAQSAPGRKEAEWIHGWKGCRTVGTTGCRY
jgi:hypothetical protein